MIKIGHNIFISIRDQYKKMKPITPFKTIIKHYEYHEEMLFCKFCKL